MPTIVNCKRCQIRCQVDILRNPNAKMLRHSNKGLCVNCAVHDWLRNTYPPNILLAQSGPKILLLPHIQEQFAEIMNVGFADAKPDEIDWNKIVDNWDLPFPTKMKPSGMNPCNQEEIDAIAAEPNPGFFDRPSKSAQMLLDCRGDITSFEQLNELSPGLGDEFKSCLRAQDE